jgi:hypothetical protein
MKHIEKLAYCGIFCGGCTNFKENYNCMGCRDEEEMVNDCPTRTCCIQKGLIHCGECSDFPCEELNNFYNDGVQHHNLAFTNMNQIKKDGLNKWLHEQEEKHTCKCGQKKRWFADKCDGNNGNCI